MKKTDAEMKKVDDELLDKRDSPVHIEADTASFDWTITRRTLMRQMAFAGIGLALPWKSILFAPQRDPKKALPELFKISDGGKTVVGPFGEVRVVVGEEEIVPVLIKAAGGLAVMDFTGRKALVRFGNGKEAITFNTGGVQFGEAPIQKWDTTVVSKLVAAIAKDRRKARGAMLLRSTLHTAYPVAVREVNTKQARNRRMGRAVADGAVEMSLWVCETHTETETVETCVTRLIDKIKTAEERYEECYDKEVNRNPCKSVPFGGAGACAAAVCVAEGFVDLVVGVIEVVTCIVDVVIHEVTKCKINMELLLNQLPNQWDLRDLPLIGGAVRQPSAAFSRGDIDQALNLLKRIGDFLGPFGCILGGSWSLAQVDTKLRLGKNGETIVIPYGVEVCINAECATQLSDPGAFANALGAWGLALSTLAALSPEAAAVLATLGVTPAAGVGAIIASLPPAAVAAAALILAFLLEVLWYATAISGQLAVHRLLGSFDDGKVCIVHPTFAIALFTLLTTNPAAVSIPPIVTG